MWRCRPKQNTHIQNAHRQSVPYRSPSFITHLRLERLKAKLYFLHPCVIEGVLRSLWLIIPWVRLYPHMCDCANSELRKRSLRFGSKLQSSWWSMHLWLVCQEEEEKKHNRLLVLKRDYVGSNILNTKCSLYFSGQAVCLMVEDKCVWQVCVAGEQTASQAFYSIPWGRGGVNKCVKVKVGLSQWLRIDL